jgi:hypothetical protein
VDFSSSYSVMDQSACCAAPPTATVIAPAMRLKTIRTIVIAFNSDDGKNNHRRWFGVCVDIFATARARAVGKSDDFTHCSPPSAPAWFPWSARPASFRN